MTTLAAHEASSFRKQQHALSRFLATKGPGLLRTNSSRPQQYTIENCPVVVLHTEVILRDGAYIPIELIAKIEESLDWTMTLHIAAGSESTGHTYMDVLKDLLEVDSFRFMPEVVATFRFSTEGVGLVITARRRGSS